MYVVDGRIDSFGALAWVGGNRDVGRRSDDARVQNCVLKGWDGVKCWAAGFGGMTRP